MAATIPDTEPTELRAGDTFKWTRSLPDYLPADSWTLKYVFMHPDGKNEITASDNGDGSHLASATAADTRDWAAGNYRWVAFVTKGAERFTVDQGSLTVLENLDVLDAFDPRSDARKYLDALIAARQSFIDSKGLITNYSIGGRSRSFESLDDVDAAIRRARRDVKSEEAAERRAKGLPSRAKVALRFVG